MNKKLQITTVIYNMKQTVGLVDDQVLARCIGTMLYDVPMTRSGLVSSALLDQYGYRPALSKCCSEHFHSRQQSGYMIIDMLSNDCTIDELTAFINECTTVHLTTSHENHVLSGIQNHPETKNLTWQEQYAMAGIELVEDPGTMPIKMQNKLKKM